MGYSRKGGKLLVSLQEFKVKVFVLNKDGKPLMPTTPRKARLLRESGQAKVVGHDPYTLQLLYGSSGYVQPVTVGLDAGYATVGFSAVTDKEELLSGELTLLKGMSERLKERGMYRRQRRSCLRHRRPGADRQFKPTGWLAPSIQHKLDSHVQLVEKIKTILPVTRVVIEVASFDIQQLKASGIAGVEYQQGEQAGYWNLREYILHRDEHECQNPDCALLQRAHRGKPKVLEIHHLGYWKGDRSNRPANLITLCTKCHTPRNHQPGGLLHGWQPALKSFRPETFMTMVRWRMVEAVKGEYTYGYITKSGRIALGLPKTHAHDAFVIAGGTTQTRADLFLLEQIRRNNRSLQLFYDAHYVDTRTGQKVSGQQLNSGRRKRNKNLNGENLRVYRGPKVSKGRVSIRRSRYAYQPNDWVKYERSVYRVQGVQSYGAYIKLAGLPKPVRMDRVSPVCWRKGMCRKWTTNGKTEPNI